MNCYSITGSDINVEAKTETSNAISAAAARSDVFEVMM